jgi:hypothetical protein
MGLYETTYLLLSADFVTERELLGIRGDDDFTLRREKYNNFFVLPRSAEFEEIGTTIKKAEKLMSELPAEKFNGYLCSDASDSTDLSTSRHVICKIIDGKFQRTV